MAPKPTGPLRILNISSFLRAFVFIKSILWKNVEGILRSKFTKGLIKIS
jgi:hypothetical protein